MYHLVPQPTGLTGKSRVSPLGGKNSLNPTKTRVCATGSVKLRRFDASVRKSPMGRERFDSRLSASQAASVLQSVAALAGS